jgi:DNA-binding transcriptional regulator YiaG
VIVTDDARRVNPTLVLLVSLLGREVCHADIHAWVFRDVLRISFAEPRIIDDAILQPDYVDSVLALRRHIMVSFSGWKGSLYEDARMSSQVSRFPSVDADEWEPGNSEAEARSPSKRTISSAGKCCFQRLTNCESPYMSHPSTAFMMDGKFLKDLREKMEMSQAEFASKLEIEETSLVAMERGELVIFQAIDAAVFVLFDLWIRKIEGLEDL